MPGALQLQDFPVAAFGRIEIFKQRAGIAEIAEGIGQFLGISGRSIVLDGSFPGRPRLHKIPAVKKDSRAMLVSLSHAGPASLPLWECPA